MHQRGLELVYAGYARTQRVSAGQANGTEVVTGGMKPQAMFTLVFVAILLSNRPALKEKVRAFEESSIAEHFRRHLEMEEGAATARPDLE